MNTLVLLDAGPLDLITNPRASRENQECNLWLEGLLMQGVQVRIPEIADYEVRRELLRADKSAGIQRLNNLKYLGYLPITTYVMLKAALFWAELRKKGKPTADNKALDADVILAAQATMAEMEGYAVIVATTNVGHLSRLVDAKEWRNI